MTNNFIQTEDNVLSVRTPFGKVEPVPIPSGVTDLAFRNVLAATDVLFRRTGKLPAVSDIATLARSVPSKTIAFVVTTDEFKQAMDYRGIQWDAESGLSIEQSMALLALTDPTDKRTTKAKLSELGIPLARYQAWMKWPLFAEIYKERTEELFRDAVPMALNKMVANAEVGDQRAIEKILEITGRYDPNNKQIEDMRLLVTKLVEAIIEYTTPEQRASIMSKISLHTAILSSGDSRQIGR